MVEEKSRIHDFLSKLRQESSIESLRSYVDWQRKLRADPEIVPVPPPSISLLSINLDLTTGCNHACTFCVDAEILNKGNKLPLEEILATVDTLARQGLRSVILIGGGEPTAHRDFVPVVRFIKD